MGMLGGVGEIWAGSGFVSFLFEDVGFKSCLSHLTRSRPSEPVVLSELSKAVLFFSPSLSGDHLAIALLENGECVGLFKNDNGL